MNNFFSTPEFIFLNKLKERIVLLNTKNNMKKYKEHLNVCIKLAENKYNCVGYRMDTDSYSWAEIKDCGPELNDLGDFKTGFSFMPDSNLFASDDLLEWAVRDNRTRMIYRYNKCETMKLKNCSINELQKIHNLKVEFEGNIVDGIKERDTTSNKNKKVPKLFGI